MCGGLHYGEVEGLVSVERWSCGRGALCVVECTTGMAEGCGTSCTTSATCSHFPS